MTLIVSVAALGTLSEERGEATPRSASLIVQTYVPMLLVNWGLLLYVCRVGRSRSALSSLVGTGFRSVRRAALDVGLALLAGVLLVAGELAWHRGFGTSRSATVDALLPTTLPEYIVWCVVAASAGFCEEVVYRGYLQKQFAAFTERPLLAVVLQAFLFGIAHGAQGFGTSARFFAYGVGFGVLARARKSLIPGILAHVAVDVLAGFVR